MSRRRPKVLSSSEPVEGDGHQRRRDEFLTEYRAWADLAARSEGVPESEKQWRVALLAAAEQLVADWDPFGGPRETVLRRRILFQAGHHIGVVSDARLELAEGLIPSWSGDDTDLLDTVLALEPDPQETASQA